MTPGTESLVVFGWAHTELKKIRLRFAVKIRAGLIFACNVRAVLHAFVVRVWVENYFYLRLCGEQEHFLFTFVV